MAFTWRFLVLTVLLTIPIALGGSWEFLVAGLAFLFLVGVGDFFLAPSTRSIQALRSPGDRIRLGLPTSATLTLVNTGKRTARLHVRDAWAPTAGASDNRFRTVIKPGETFERVQHLLPVRRGVLPADKLTLRSTSVLGFVARQKSFDVPAQIRVMPPFHSRKHLPSKRQKLRELDGRTALMVRGMGTEFDSLREYVRGDDIRSIDWRATARAQKLMTKTWRPERDRRVVIVIDSSRLAARRADSGTVFDAAVESAMLLAALAAGAGDRVDVIVADARVRLSVGPLSGKDPLGVLTNKLTPIDPELIDTDWTTVTSAVMETSPNHAFVVFVTSLDALTIAEDVLPAIPLLRSRHTVAFASVEDPQLEPMSHNTFTPTQTYQAAAAAQQLMTESSLQGALTHLGIHTVSGFPEDLPPRLADLYIHLKSIGRL